MIQIVRPEGIVRFHGPAEAPAWVRGVTAVLITLGFVGLCALLGIALTLTHGGEPVQWSAWNSFWMMRMMR